MHPSVLMEGLGNGDRTSPPRWRGGIPQRRRGAEGGVSRQAAKIAKGGERCEDWSTATEHRRSREWGRYDATTQSTQGRGSTGVGRSDRNCVIPS
jgi:hypothetical protein